jgi:hypothetical protein
MAMIVGMTEVLVSQVIYILILGLITHAVIKKGRKRGFLHWFTVSINVLYGLSFGWLFYEYSSFRTNADSGQIFVWLRHSFIIPGILVLAASIVFMLNERFKKAG